MPRSTSTDATGVQTNPVRMESDMNVKFVSSFDYTPSGESRVQIAYPEGWEGTVKRECGEAAIAAGRATETVVQKVKKTRAET